MNPYEALKLDKRSFPQIFWDLSIQENDFLNLIYFDSILKPLWVRAILFYFSLSTLFFMNAIFFTDNEIDKRADKSKEKRVKIFIVFILKLKFFHFKYKIFIKIKNQIKGINNFHSIE